MLRIGSVGSSFVGLVFERCDDIHTSTNLNIARCCFITHSSKAAAAQIGDFRAQVQPKQTDKLIIVHRGVQAFLQWLPSIFSDNWEIK